MVLGFARAIGSRPGIEPPQTAVALATFAENLPKMAVEPVIGGRRLYPAGNRRQKLHQKRIC
jgi:hypothetical protein